MQTIAQQYVAVRQQFHSICTPLAIEDYGLQAMPETSPAKWHLAHTSWFFETFLLKPYLNNYTPFQEQFEVLFNSYYNGIGEQYARAQCDQGLYASQPAHYRSGCQSGQSHRDDRRVQAYRAYGDG